MVTLNNHLSAEKEWNMKEIGRLELELSDTIKVY